MGYGVFLAALLVTFPVNATQDDTEDNGDPNRPSYLNITPDYEQILRDYHDCPGICWWARIGAQLANLEESDEREKLVS